MAITPRITPVPSNVIPFSYEFINRMRSDNEIKKKPSVRQTQAIPHLLSARYFRNGRLTLDDFIEAAVYTTYPPDQMMARRIAEDIVLGREIATPRVKVKVETTRQKRQERQSALDEVLDRIKREQELAKTIVKEKVEAGYQYLQDLRSRPDKTLHKSAMDYMNEGDVVLSGLSSDDELIQKAKSELLDRQGNLTSRDIQNSTNLDALDDVCNLSNAAERLAGKALRGDKDVQEEFSKLASRDPATAARALRMMDALGKPGEKEQQAMDRKLQQSIKDLSEVTDYSSQLDRVPDNIQDHIEDAASRYSLADSSQFTDRIKEHTGQDLTSDMLQAYDEQYDNGASQNVDVNQLAGTATDDQSWRSLVEKKTDDITERASERSAPSDYLRQKHMEMNALKKHMKTSQQRQTWENSMQQIADSAVQRSPTKSHLRRTVNDLSRHGTIPSREAVQNTGKQLGMSEAEIQELLNPSFQVIKKLIQNGVSDFERLHNLMSAAGLSSHQLQQLADLASTEGNQGALGAIAHEDLHAALGTGQGRGRHRGYGSAQEYDKKRAEDVFSGLLGGPATNIVKMWYSYRDELPPELKKRLHEIAKRLLIDLGMRFARQTMGTSMLGGIQQSTTVRPFRIGDDIDLIDLEETIDSMMASGRYDFTGIDAEDFLITETYQGHRAFFWGLDKSGSMDSAEKLGMLAISVMAGIYGVQKDDFGVVLFDHDTHVVKAIPDKSIVVESVAGNLLDARAGGGTGGASTMRLALQNFEETRAKEKIFIFSTDMFLSDQKECESLARKMKNQDIKLIVLVPKTSYNPTAANALAKAAHGVVLDIARIEELPVKLLRITNY